MYKIEHKSCKKEGDKNMKKASDVTQDNHCRTWFAKIGGFTLAEVLITLAVIGVVAAITMPILVQNVQSRVKAKRIENIHQKLSKATDKMAVQSGLTGYGSTMDFVQELSKHMKLAKICDNDNLSSCWPVEKVVTRKDGTTWNIKDTKTAKELEMSKSSRENWFDTIGIVTIDGISMILSYKKDCDFNVDTQGLQFDKETSTSNSLKCISGVFDWNGGRNPNKLGDDVITLGNASGLGNKCVYETSSGICIAGKAVSVVGLTKTECEQKKEVLGIKKCKSDGDKWAAAVDKCGGVNNMFSDEELKEIAKDIYSSDGKDASKAQALGLPGDYRFWIWTKEEYSNDRYNAAYYFSFDRYFYNSEHTQDRSGSNPLAFCKTN